MTRGEHFFVWRRHKGIPFQHHAIDLGDGDVVHFADDNGGIAGPGGSSDAFRIQRASIAAATREGRDVIHVIEHGQRLSPDEIVARALSQCGRGGYHLVFDNCEHFACWCATGRCESQQVAAACQRLTAAAFKALAAGAAHASTKVGVKRLVAVNPWMLLADAAQWMTEATGHHLGLRDPSRRKHASRAVGVATALGVGACAGPGGAVVSGGLWVAGELAGQLSQATYHQARQRRRAGEDD